MSKSYWERPPCACRCHIEDSQALRDPGASLEHHPLWTPEPPAGRINLALTGALSFPYCLQCAVVILLQMADMVTDQDRTIRELKTMEDARRADREQLEAQRAKVAELRADVEELIKASKRPQ